MEHKPLAAHTSHVAPRAAAQDTGTLLGATSVDSDTEVFLRKLAEVYPAARTELVERAFRFSWHAHRNQRRKSGEPYLSHPVAVALILAEQHLDPITITAGLLHDVLEDSSIRREQLEAQFGSSVAMLVDGVTKIQAIQIPALHERKAETYRKLLLSMAEDVRVVIIKFADRLHNLRTLRYLDPQRITAVAQETLDIYAPLAHRLGMARMRWDLEDLAFKHLHPKTYKEIVAKVVSSGPERERLIDSFADPLRWKLKQEGIEATIVGRPKHFYSIYRKLVEQARPFDEIFDLLAIRVIINSERDCYLALGVVHSLWKPIPDRFKDFIGMPKSNGYRSLHTTVVGETGHTVEVQIRTWEMHQVAEDGIAAHWIYKEGGSGPGKDDQALVWLKNLIDWQKDLTDSSEFYEFFRIDMFDAEVFVFTPKGDLISLPRGATVLDFAFAVHSEMGLHCIGARIDGTFMPPNHRLKSGTTVEVLHLSTRKPSADWLRDVRTPRARSAIRRWLSGAGRNQSIELGRRIVEANHKRLHVSAPLDDIISELLQHFGVSNIEQLYEKTGKAEITAARIAVFFRDHTRHGSGPSRVVSQLVDTLTGKPSGVVVDGSDNMMVRFGHCCNPIPGDTIVGFVTGGRGLVVHRGNCENAALFLADTDRCMEVTWDTRVTNTYIVFLELEGQDRPGLLHDATGVLVNFGSNVLEARVQTTGGHFRNTFKIQIQNRNQLRQIIERLQRIRGVERITRSRENMTATDINNEAAR